MPASGTQISLGQLLKEAGLTLRANPAGPPRPVSRDLVYNTALLFMIMLQMGRKRSHDSNHLALNSIVAKFSHFACKHPQVVAEYEEWYIRRYRKSDRMMLLWHGQPKGYLSDTVFEKTVHFLCVLGYMKQQGKDLLLPCSEDSEAQAWLTTIHEKALFLGERKLLDRLRKYQVTQIALGVD